VSNAQDGHGHDPAAEAFSGGGGLGELMARHDWTHTPLGPPRDWPQPLLTSLGLCVRSPFPMVVLWGPDGRYFYNDAYLPIIADKHPWALGRAVREIWPEVWPELAPHIEAARAGRSSLAEDGLWLLNRRGFVEECYVTLAFSPIPHGDGVGGVLVVLHEVTGTVLGARRLAVLRDIPEACSGLLDPADVCRAAAGVLATDPRDMPFTALYRTDGDVARLVGAAGVAEDDPRFPAAVEPGGPHDAWGLAEPGEHLVEGLRARGAPPDDAPDRAVVLPVPSAQGAATVLVAGLSPMRPLDEDYRSFLRLVAAAVGTELDQAGALAAERARVAALAALDRAKTEFFADVSHEFRTPLTLLLGPLQDAVEDGGEPLGPRQAERVAVVRRNALRLQRLVENLLDFSRVEADRADLHAEPTDLAAFTAELASVFRSAVERAGLRLDVDAPPLPRPVPVDRPMWEKVVLNLLSNAVKFTFVGSIGVTVRDGGDAAEVVVSDTGVGIEPGDVPHVFDRFYRVRGARSRSHEGSGIGLALVRELLAAHGATIALASEPGAGSTFTIRVPYGGAAPAGAVHPEDELRLPAPSAPSAASLPYLAETRTWPAEAVPDPVAADDDRPVLLLAEDNADMAAYLGRVLGERWRVRRRRTGTEALAAALAEPPDLVLADVMMPGMDGVELVRRLRAEPATAALPVVLLTARAGQDAVLQGLAAGADDYLTKPFTSADLLARLDSRYRLARDRRAAAPAPEPAPAAPGPRRELSVPRVPGALRGLRGVVAEFLVEAGAGPAEVDGIVLAFGEAATNLVEHRPAADATDAAADAEGAGDDRLRVVLSVVDGVAEIALTAAGPYLGRAAPGGRGRGAALMAAQAQVRVQPADGELTVVLRRRLAAAG
jgi:signal transduction histidine kinase/CheY-like chemotaxis protein